MSNLDAGTEAGSLRDQAEDIPADRLAAKSDGHGEASQLLFGSEGLRSKLRVRQTTVIHLGTTLSQKAERNGLGELGDTS